MQYIPEIERQPLAQQAIFQSRKLQELLQYLQANSPYYQRIFREQNIDINSVKTLADIASLPVTTKEDLQNFSTEHLCVAPDKIREYAATSGTLGAPVTIALSAQDLERLAYNEYLSFNCMEPGNTYQLMLTLDRQFMAGMAYYSGLQKAEKAVVRTGPALPAMQWEVIDRLKSDTLVAVPSFLLKMADYAKANDIDLKSTPVKQVLAIGESLRDEDLQPSALAQKIQEAWPVALYGTYASTEMQTAFTECSAFAGGHHHPELIIVELLDDEGKQVAEDACGEVTITTLGVEAMPLLRYKTGDLCKAYYEPCSCGRTTMRLGPVLGRKAQMIKYKGTSLYPASIANLLHEQNIIQDYAMELKSDDAGQDVLILHIQTSAGDATCNEILRPVLQHKLRVVPQLVYHTAHTMQQLLFPAGGRKPNRFIDNRK